MPSQSRECGVSALEVATLQRINEDLDEDIRTYLQNVDPSTFDLVEVNGESSQGEMSAVKGRIQLTSFAVGDVSGKKTESTEHYKMFQKFIDILTIIGIPLGMELRYDWDPKRYKMFYLFAMVFGVAFILKLNTQRMHIVNGDYAKTLEIFAVYGVTASIFLKIAANVKYSSDVMALIDNTRQICKSNVAGARAEILRKHFHKCFFYFRCSIYCMILSAILYFCGAIKDYFETGEKAPLLPIYVFIDQSEWKGYIYANLFFAVLGTGTYIITMYYVLSFGFCIVHISLRVDLIQQDFSDLSGMWANERHSRYRHAFLRNICVKVQDVEDYIAELKRIYEGKIFIYLCFNYVCQIICCFEVTVIFLLSKHGWTPGYGIAMGSFLEMMVYCTLGTLLSTYKENLCAVLWDADWHTYDIESQKTVLNLICIAQNLQEIWIGSLRRLDVITGIEVIKSIYSYYTVMVEVM